MKQSQVLIDQLNTISYFDKGTVRLIAGTFGEGLTRGSLDTTLNRFVRSGQLISLKNGFYISADYYRRHNRKPEYLFMLANVLRRPSYVSSWTALQYYGLATEAIRTFTSVTTQVTRSYDSRVGSFSYQSISKRLFGDFVVVGDDAEFFIATPAKALFDLLYFRTKQFRDIKQNDIAELVGDLRIDLDEMTDHDRQRFWELIGENVRSG